MVASRDQVGYVLARYAEGLFQESDDHMGRRPDRVEDVARVNDEIHIPLQDGVNGPSVSLLDVDLALVAARLGIELRVPRVAEVCIRDVGYPYDLIPLFNPVLFRPKHMMDLPGPQFRVWCLAISDRTCGSRSFGISTKA